MPATRPNLILDEQAFQGLLAAAFTVQQHNDRQKQSSNSAAPTDKPQPAGDLAELCAHCGAPIATEASSCPACGEEGLRPGERLQRTWASMWQLSQEQGVRHEPSDIAAAQEALPFHHLGEGLPLDDPPSAVSTSFPNARASRAKAPTASSNYFPDVSATQSSAAVTSVRRALPESSREKIEWPPEHPDRSQRPVPASALSTGEADVLDESLPASSLAVPPLDDSLIVDSLPDEDSLTDFSLDDPSLADPTAETAAMNGGPFQRLLRKLRLDRADFYLGMAFLIAAAALLWPAATSSQYNLSPWKRALVAMGIAETPPPAAHYRGDPDIKVWVDTHAALYYCPGDDLYGKSPDGHFTTQREAQADRFEPAQRSACIQ